MLSGPGLDPGHAISMDSVGLHSPMRHKIGRKPAQWQELHEAMFPRAIQQYALIVRVANELRQRRDISRERNGIRGVVHPSAKSQRLSSRRLDFALFFFVAFLIILHRLGDGYGRFRATFQSGLFASFE